MRSIWVSSLVLNALVAAAAAQAHPIGVTDVAWDNLSGFGTPVLTARVCYPAVSTGVRAPVLFQKNGWPTIVLLHGYSFLGNDYQALGDALAESGFITVMMNTAQFSHIDMENDARAIVDAIGEANQTEATLLAGAFDTEKIGLMGHSMGGAVLAYVLSDDPANLLNNPGYRCGLSIAPVDPGAAIAATVHVPMGVISGLGDTLTPTALHASVLYEHLAPTMGLKFHYKMGMDCGHMNVVGIAPNSPAVFERTKRIVAGFFHQILGGDILGMEGVCGPDALVDPVYFSFDREVVNAQIWAAGGLQIGQTQRVSLIGEPGLGGLIAAATLLLTPTPTPFGLLWLDPLSAFPMTKSALEAGRLDIWLTVPNQIALVGSTFALQGIATSTTLPYTLGSALQFDIQ